MNSLLRGIVTRVLATPSGNENSLLRGIVTRVLATPQETHLLLDLSCNLLFPLGVLNLTTIKTANSMRRVTRKGQWVV